MQEAVWKDLSGNPESTKLRSVYSGSRIVDMLEVARASGQFDERYMFEISIVHWH